MTAPLPTTTETVIVSVTTLRQSQDQTVVLRIGDHPYIRHDSAVRYSDARIEQGERIAREIESGAISSHARCTDGLIDEIEAGLRSSPFTVKKILKFLGEQ